MNWIYNKLFISNNEMLFYIFLFLMLLIIIVSIIIVNKELKKQNDSK